MIARKALIAIILVLLLNPSWAARRDGWELNLGINSGLNALVEGTFEAGPRVDFGFYSRQFYAGGSLAWLYSSLDGSGDVLASLRCGIRFESARRPAFFSVFAEAQYWGGPWRELDSPDAEPESGIFSLNFHPALSLRFTEWLAFNLEFPIAFPLSGERTDVSLQARLYLYAYF